MLVFKLHPKYMALTVAVIMASGIGAAPAEAATYIITYQGTVANSTDATGVFGGSGNSLDGLSFTAVYTLTAPLPGAITTGGPTFSYAQIYGGSLYGAPGPLSGTLTINGWTQAVAGDYFSTAVQINDLNPGSDVDEVTHHVESRDSDTSDGNFHLNYFDTTIYSRVNSFLSIADYTAPLNYSTQPGDVGGGYFRFEGYSDFGANAYYAVGNLKPTSVTIALAPDTGAVPEPATWAMMIAGFGMVGSAMRRRRVSAAYTAA